MLVCLLCASCAPRQPRKVPAPRGGPLTLAERLVFPDIPAPAGFVLLDKEVRGREQDRVAILIYQGSATLDELEEFYRRQMAVGDWREKKRHELLAERILSYRKGAQHCVVALRKQDGWARVELRLNNY